MPKPENPGSHGKGRDKVKGRKPSIQKFLDKGWNDIVVPAGQTRSEEEVPLVPETQDLIIKGQVFDADGVKIVGRDRPHSRVEESATGASVVVSKPATEDYTFLYKVVDEEQDEAEESGQLPL